MHLSLRSLQDAHEHFEKRFEPSLFPAAEGDPFRVVSPVTLSFDVDRQEPGRYRVAGHRDGRDRADLQPCLEPFTLPIASDFDLRYVPRTENVGEGEREVEEDDLATAFYDDEQIDLGASDHGAVPARAADEAAVHGGLQRSVPAVRNESEHRLVRLQPELGRSAARCAEER